MTNTGIECFLAICRHKTASAAARALFITQPSLSARLKVLEQEVGAQLFYRNKGSREMQLTDVGHEFYQLALQYEVLINKMKTLGDEKKNTLRIACFSSLDTYLLTPVYRLFLQTNPQFSLQIQDVGNLSVTQGILQGESDIAFSTSSFSHSQIQRIPIFSEPMVLVCAADSALQGPVTQSKLSAQNEILVKWSDDFTCWHQEFFDNSQPQFCVSTMIQLRQFLEEEKGWSIVPLSVAKGLAAEGNIRQLETDILLPRRQTSCLVSIHRQISALGAFLDCLRQVLADQPEYELLL